MSASTDEQLMIAPARPVTHNDVRQVLFEAGATPSGEPVGLAFTSVRRLVEAMGEQQPWVRLPLLALKEFHAAAGIGRLAVDPHIEELLEREE